MSARSPRRFITIHLDPEEMARRGKIGAHVTHSRHDARELTAPARQAAFARFEQEVDPEQILPEAERLRRAEHARRAHMLRIAHKSALVRSARKEAADAVA